MMSARRPGGTHTGRQSAFASHTSTAAETSFTTVTPALPAGATGKPILIKASGSISGVVQIQFGNNAQYQLPVAPNQNPVEWIPPPSAFPNDVNSVSIGIECSGGVGTILVVVEFAVKA